MFDKIFPFTYIFQNDHMVVPFAYFWADLRRKYLIRSKFLVQIILIDSYLLIFTDISTIFARKQSLKKMDKIISI